MRARFGMEFKEYPKLKPRAGQCVLWAWAFAGQITAGDFYQGKPRDAAKNYEPISGIQPSHWCEWPLNWP